MKKKGSGKVKDAHPNEVAPPNVTWARGGLLSVPDPACARTKRVMCTIIAVESIII